MKRRKKNGGFTLVELMVVAVIVAVLAAVAIPLMTSNKKRAMATEAEAALGTIRSALRGMLAETGAYNVDRNGDAITAPVDAVDIIEISEGDLDGRFFSDASYEITEVGTTNYLLTATGDDSEAPKAADVAGLEVTLDEGGQFTRDGF